MFVALLLGPTGAMAQSVSFGEQLVGTASPSQAVTVTAQTAGVVNTVEVLTLGSSGLDFAPGSGAMTCPSASLSVGATCTESVVFTPAYPGLRMGAVVLLDSGSNVLGATYISGTGLGGLGILALGNVLTVAGDGDFEGPVGDGGLATRASLNHPSGVVLDGAGNLYIADRYHNRIRKVSASTQIITTIAGNGNPGYTGDGLQSTNAGVSINTPWGVALDGAGNLYIADTGNNRVREISAATGIITTVAGNGAIGDSDAGTVGDGGLATAANLNQPQGVSVDSSGNLYIADTFNHRVRRVDALTGIITTVAGNGYTDPVTGAGGFGGNGGQATEAKLNFPFAVAFDQTGDMYIPDSANNVVRVVNSVGVISTFAGNGTPGEAGDGGPAISAALFSPSGVVLDPAGNVYIADTQNWRIQKVSSATGFISTFASYWVTSYTTSTGIPDLEGFYGPIGMYLDGSGNLYFADSLAMKVQEVQSNLAILDYIPTPVRQGSESAAQRQDIENDGNISLDLTAITAETNAAVDETTTTCTVSSPSLAVNADCVVGVIFAPSAAGDPLAGNVNILGSTVNSPLDIELLGDATAVNSTTTALTSSLNPSNYGQGVIFSATVTTGAGSGSLTGSVTFNAGATVLGTVKVNSSGVASFSYSALTVGVHPITATYGGDSTHFDSTSAALNQTVEEPTTTVVNSSGTPSDVGQTVTLTATVTASAGGGVTPDGTVTFFDGATYLSTATLNATGGATPTASAFANASIATATLSNGVHSIIATYNGDSANQISGSVSTAFKQDVVEPSLAVVVSTPNPSNFGSSVTFTVSVTSSATVGPTGTILLLDGGKQIATASLTAGTATITSSSLAVGSHTITASYQGDTNNSSATSAAITQLVNQAPTLTTVSASPSPAVVGAPMTITATVKAIVGSATPSGTVTFTDTFNGGPVNLGTSSLSKAGVATVTPALAVGSHSIVATYAGDTDDGTSASAPLTLNVQIATTSTTISSSSNPSIVEAAVTFTGTVTGNGGMPTGNVTFAVDGTSIGSARVGSNGTASLSCSTLAPGTHSVTASYGGDPNDQPSTSAAISQVVGTIKTVTALSSTTTKGPPAQLILLAAVAGVSGPTPTGTVTFTSGTTILGAAPLNSEGVANLTPILSPGTYSVLAAYGGDTLHSPSTSSAISVSGAGTVFSLGVTPSTISVASTENVTVTVTVNSISGFTDTISLGCLGLPAGVNCHFSSNNLTLASNGSETAQLTIDTNNPLGGGASAMNRRTDKQTAALAGLFLPFNLILGWIIWRSRKRHPGVFSAALIILLNGVLLMSTGCGGFTQSSAAPGTYVIQVAGAGVNSNVTEYQTVTLTITPVTSQATQ